MPDVFLNSAEPYASSNVRHYKITDQTVTLRIATSGTEGWTEFMIDVDLRAQLY